MRKIVSRPATGRQNLRRRRIRCDGFLANDVVVLDGPRCDGSSHDGCKHGCRIYWKQAWLRPVDSDDAELSLSTPSSTNCETRLKVKTDERHYFCQSTELYKSTEAFPPGERFRRARIVLTEIRNGDLGMLQALQLYAVYLWQKSSADSRL